MPARVMVPAIAGPVEPTVQTPPWHAKAQTRRFDQRPKASQTSLPPLLQRVAPAAGHATQVPFEQSGVVSLQEPLCQTPLESHHCGMSPLHCAPPGTHEPVQAPAEQTYGQAAALCQVPSAPQVWGIPTLHCFAPGTQLPAHVPPLQTNGQRDALCQLPVASQVWGTLPLHSFEPGAQDPEHTPAAQT
jgi:hypothetical protein